MIANLTADEHRLLAEVLREYLEDLRTEIRLTDSHDYRAGMRRREEEVRAILEKVETQSIGEPV